MDEVPGCAAWLDRPDATPIAITDGCTLGRHLSNRVVLENQAVSRHHARIDVRNRHEFWLTDLSSQNGTHLNGRRVVEPVQLRDGDRLVVGDRPFFFRQNSPDPISAEDAMAFVSTQSQNRVTDCWLLVADMERSVSLSRTLPPEQLAKVLGEWLGRCRQIIESHGGEINKFLGDGLLAFWNDRSDMGRDVANALGELRSYQENSKFTFRIALHHGLVGMDSSIALREEGLLGAEVNFVFRMEKLAGSLGESVLISEAAASRLAPFMRTKPLNAFELPGFPGSHLFFSV